MNHTAETNLYAERDITERLREHAAIHEAQVPFDNEQREWADDLRFAAAEIARLRARVAKLESARGEPVAWMNPYGGTLQVRITGLEYEKYTIPLYTAPPAQAVDVDAIAAFDLASEFFGSGLPHYIADWVVPAIMRAAEIERETCAQKCLERHANGRFKHDTRDECADAIRAMGE